MARRDPRCCHVGTCLPLPSIWEELWRRVRPCKLCVIASDSQWACSLLWQAGQASGQTVVAVGGLYCCEVVVVVRGAFRKITLDIKERFMLLGINQGFGFKLSALLSSLIVRLDGKSDSVHQSLAPLAEGQAKTNTVFHESILRERVYWLKWVASLKRVAPDVNPAPLSKWSL